LTLRDLAIFEHLRIPQALVEEAGIERVTDLAARERFGIKGSGDMGGLIFPYLNPLNGRRWTARLRRNNPEIENGRPQNKYISAPGDRKHLYFPPGSADLLADAAVPVILVEAEKSSLGIMAYSRRVGRNLLALALGGCWGWRGKIGIAENQNGARVDEKGTLPDLIDVCIKGRKVYVLLDSNVCSNPKVQAARQALVRQLRKLKADVHVLDLPLLDGVNGPDDFLALKGDEAMKALLDGPANQAPGQLGEHDLALRFSERYKDLRYVAQWGRWMLFRSPWREDNILEVFDRARAICCEAASECETQKATTKWLKAAATRAAVENLARSDKRHAATTEQWDCDRSALGVRSKVCDLRTAEVREQIPEDYLTRSTAIQPAMTADCPLWLRFLEDITDDGQRSPEDNSALRNYLQRVAGYCLTGLTIEQVLFFFYGTGANGKTVLTNTLLGLLGDYAQVASIETFTETKNERHPTSLASLRGARLVVVSETKGGQSWDESKVKALTGGDPIRARFCRCDEFEYVPQFKLLVHGNKKPALRNVDEAIAKIASHPVQRDHPSRKTGQRSH
jgi:hypothetical protein